MLEPSKNFMRIQRGLWLVVIMMPAGPVSLFTGKAKAKSSLDVLQQKQSQDHMDLSLHLDILNILVI